MSISRIRAIALDVDGVLTDGTFYWGPGGEEWKRFSFADVMGVSLAVKAGLFVSLISGEDSPLVERYAAKFGLSDVAKGCTDKGSALRAFAKRRQLDLAEIAFMGDDVNDLPAMQIAGMAGAPANAQPVVLERAAFVSRYPGGCGAVREMVDAILTARASYSAT